MITEEELKEILEEIENIKKNDPETFENCMNCLMTVKES